MKNLEFEEPSAPHFRKTSFSGDLLYLFETESIRISSDKN